MNTPNYPDTMSAPEAERRPEQRKNRSAWALLWFVPLGVAVRNIDPISRAALVATVGVFGALAVFAGRDVRERVGGAVATVAMLGSGGLAMWLLTPGRALLAIVAVFAILATVLVVWAKHRTPPAARPDVSGGLERPRTPAERRAAMEARMAEGVERDRRQRADREAEYERAAEQRRAEGAARREAEAADAR